VNRVFLDTSAVLALLNPGDKGHRAAKRAFGNIRARRAALLTTSYVLVETYALLARRLGLEAVEAFRTDFEPLLDVVWVDADLHAAGLDLLLRRKARKLSLVDAVSFLVIRGERIDEVFARDAHFRREGFPLSS